MKNTHETFTKRYPKTVIIIASLFLVLMVMSLKAYDKSTTLSDDEALKSYKPESVTSVSMTKTDYKIDFDIITTNQNKQRLLDRFKAETISESQYKAGIPNFILSFMESISKDKQFQLADAGEPWCVNDIMGYTLTKMYDSQKREMVDLVTPSQKVLPSNQFVYFAIGKNTALLSYWSGGLRLTQHVALIRFEGTKIIDYWENSYTNALGYTKADILKNMNSINNGDC